MLVVVNLSNSELLLLDSLVLHLCSMFIRSASLDLSFLGSGSMSMASSMVLGMLLPNVSGKNIVISPQIIINVAAAI